MPERDLSGIQDVMRAVLVRLRDAVEVPVRVMLVDESRLDASVGEWVDLRSVEWDVKQEGERGSKGGELAVSLECVVKRSARRGRVWELADRVISGLTREPMRMEQQVDGVVVVRGVVTMREVEVKVGRRSGSGPGGMLEAAVRVRGETTWV